jgi:hypothetical protein
MRDADVRSAILARLDDDHAGDTNTRIVQEMGIWSGSVRIDVAVINGELCGYELKSDRDTLERLPLQADIYSRVFDRVFLVVGERHAPKARRIVPRWWGVIVASSCKGVTKLTDAREAKRNPSPDPLLIARLLWREEALEVLEAADLAKGWRSKSAPAIHERLARELSFDDLSTAVRTCLKHRKGWLGQSVGNEGKVTVHADLNPRLAAPWSAVTTNDLPYSSVAPTTSDTAEAGPSSQCLGMAHVLGRHGNAVVPANWPSLED